MKIPDIIGKWRVVGILGRGLSGVVYKVVRVDDPTRVGALKICNASRGRPCKAFHREIGRMAEQPARGFMPRHFENGTHRGRPYFVMSLSRDLPEHLSRKEAVRTVLRIIDAAILLRDKGLWHCDYKRENVGIDENGEAVLRDYGSARTHEEANFNPAVVGTKFCRAPEVDYEGVCNEQTEVWAIGALFLGLLPFAARYTYALPILLAVHAVPFFRLRTFEELRKHIERAPQTERRRVSFLAGIWKLEIFANHAARVAIRAVACLIVGLAITLLIIHQDHRSLVQIEADYKKAVVEHREKRYLNAIKLLEPIADRKCPRTADACALLWECYHRGLGVKPNEAKCREYRLKCESAVSLRQRNAGRGQTRQPGFQEQGRSSD